MSSGQSNFIWWEETDTLSPVRPQYKAIYGSHAKVKGFMRVRKCDRRHGFEFISVMKFEAKDDEHAMIQARILAREPIISVSKYVYDMPRDVSKWRVVFKMFPNGSTIFVQDMRDAPL